MLKIIDQESFFGGPAPSPTPDQLRLCQWTPWRDVACLLRLCELHRPKRFLEVGCNLGTTTLILAEAMPDCYFVGIDPGQLIPPAERSPVQRGEYQSPERVGELVRDKLNVAIRRCTIDDLPVADKYDAIFIDADHRMAAVLNDHSEALRRLSPGGTIIYHDVGNEIVPDVRAALETLTVEVTWIREAWIAFYRPS